MLRRYRLRRGPYALAEPSGPSPVVRIVVLLLIVGLALWLAGGWVLRLFGAGNTVAGTATMMEVESGTVNVSLEGGLLQRAEGTIKLFPGDRVTTGSNGTASLMFFDGSRVRLGEQADITLDESSRGTEESEIAMTMATGTVWVRNASEATFTGSIVRTFATPAFEMTMPSDTEAIVTVRSVQIFDADGQGVLLEAAGGGELYVGEGQELTLPEGDVSTDLFSYRSALKPAAYENEFLAESRSTVGSGVSTGTGSGTNVELLTVTSPAQGATVNAATVRVEGTVGARVTRVRVNGYAVDIDPDEKTFSQELSLRNESSVEINIEALDKNDVVLTETTRTISHVTAAGLPAPVITFPAKTGDTYRTQAAELEIRGTLPSNAQGVMVNDYRLQLWKPGDATWSYLASTRLGNLHAGSNVFDVYALDASGEKSASARITILVEEGTVGVVSSGTGSTTAPAQPEQPDESTLPTNAPLKPGTVTITSPAAGHVETGTGFILYGTTDSTTASVWVNGYKLRLYVAGKTTWSYLAYADLGTLKRGKNTYRVVARDAANKIIDIFEYVTEFNP